LRKIALALVLVVFVGATVYGLLHWFRRPQPRATRVIPSALTPELPPEPDVAIQIERESELKVWRGAPLIFSVVLSNPRAMNAALENEANQALMREIAAGVAAGKIAPQSAEPRLARLRRLVPVQAVRLGDQATGWNDYIRFFLLSPDGKTVPLPWPLRIVAAPETKALSLGDTETAQLDYLLDPAAADQIAPGDYQIVATVETPAGGNVGADTWHGRVESEPVRLSVAQKPARIAPADEETTDLQFARYYQAAQDWPHARTFAEKALAANPDSVPARTLDGEVREAQADLKGALQAYQLAETNFHKQYPHSYEAPLYLINKIDVVMGQLPEQP
jgi:hypothetical protein